MKKALICDKCGNEMFIYRNPFPTVDLIIHQDYSSVVLVKRKNPPLGWALPGGFVDYGETVEKAAVREAKEETSLDVELESLFGVYSSPLRDPRHHTITVVFLARAKNINDLKSGDDAEGVGIFPIDKLPDLVFDHFQILSDFRETILNRVEIALSDGRSLCKGGKHVYMF